MIDAGPVTAFWSQRRDRVRVSPQVITVPVRQETCAPPVSCLIALVGVFRARQVRARSLKFRRRQGHALILAAMDCTVIVWAQEPLGRSVAVRSTATSLSRRRISDWCNVPTDGENADRINVADKLFVPPRDRITT